MGLLLTFPRAGGTHLFAVAKLPSRPGHCRRQAYERRALCARRTGPRSTQGYRIWQFDAATRALYLPLEGGGRPRLARSGGGDSRTANSVLVASPPPRLASRADPPPPGEGGA